MMGAIPLFAIGLGGLFLVCSAVWFLVPALYGLPWIPTRKARIRRALKLANLQPGETLFDLGSGDGRVLRMAAGEFGAHAIGVEIGPMQCLISWILTWLSGKKDKVQTIFGNFYTTGLHDADVVFLYLTSEQTSRLGPLLKAELQPGARIVSIAAELPNWKPTALDRALLIFVYNVNGK
jgi:hypothetical protein